MAQPLFCLPPCNDEMIVVAIGSPRAWRHIPDFNEPPVRYFHLGTILSSARYKTAIKPMDETSEAILALKPVTFRYKEELDPEDPTVWVDR